MTTFFESVNPYSGEAIAQYPVLEKNLIPRKLQQGHQAFLSWKTVSIEQRSAYLLRLADLLVEEKEALARLISLEMGKPIRESSSEIEKCAAMTRYYAEQGPTFLHASAVAAAPVASYITYLPMGIILGVMPWNFPLWQVLRFAVPTLLGGNAVMIKPAPNVVGCSLALELIFHKAGFPEGVFQMVLVDTPNIEPIIASPEVRGVTLTGSLRAGSAVASLAGKYIKKSVLELGGSDAFLVMSDAHIAAAAKAAVLSRFQNAGQTCIAAKRWLIHESVFDDFLSRVETELDEWILGDPLHPDTWMGPVARPDLAANLSRQLAQAEKEGAKTHRTGDHRFCQFYPTILEVQSSDHIAFQEEFFGPIASIMSFSTEDQAIALANVTTFGLGASVWTTDLDRAKKIAESLDVGIVAINQGVKSDVRLPFGGTKNSGYGRELGVLGLHEFMNIQSVWIEA